MNPKGKVKYHPNIDPKRESLVLKELYLVQLKKLQSANTRSWKEYKEALESIQKALQLSQEYKKAI
ncbi:MAG: hypothetical protein KAW56_05640, partial [Candidatus Marinimicrobia bacterium]|nr:hypothetical protein [Candidatus Neomarinimicrobiota bacterium]